MAGVNVKLSGGCQSDTSASTDSYGNYQFVNLQPGEYSVQAFDGVVDCQSCGKSMVVTKPISGNVTQNLIIPGSGCNPLGLTPILLVPGFPGSSISSLPCIPYFQGRPPNGMNLFITLIRGASMILSGSLDGSI